MVVLGSTTDGQEPQENVEEPTTPEVAEDLEALLEKFKSGELSNSSHDTEEHAVDAEDVEERFILDVAVGAAILVADGTVRGILDLSAVVLPRKPMLGPRDDGGGEVHAEHASDDDNNDNADDQQKLLHTSAITPSHDRLLLLALFCNSSGS